MYVIFGASGNVGRKTAAALRDAGHAVRAVVRNPAHSDMFTGIGCEVVQGDLDDEASLHRALHDAHAVQMLCPLPHGGADPAIAMHRMIATAARALRKHPHLHVVALSDYGAEQHEGTGITMLFHDLEAAFAESVRRLTLLRSAEHMHNWARVLPVALATGKLPSLHHPLDRPFPTVSAQDVGELAAQLLVEGRDADGVRIVSIEGPRRYDANDVARALSEAARRDITALALPRSEWTPTMLRAGLGANHAKLITDLYDAQNAGCIDVDPRSERRFGKTELPGVFAGLVRDARA
ncbi:NAD(P)H-binding protein [Paraburkholderia phymatum]|uniref:NmrA family protein n=1 Tax=Paraburkholderia phymatum (strain DSM 17167 / CIP 108236 / LMG 21445 / STM815) TaxID=391038 RepID=B2JRK4_PARP8|nr:NAD(P)H-binding protein [Paraburkholderia phymatum]ACC72331.1 NmrA family protein [Paraburkholderia phymatum STM815]